MKHEETIVQGKVLRKPLLKAINDSFCNVIAYLYRKF